jgi:hypothetical protein
MYNMVVYVNNPNESIKMLLKLKNLVRLKNTNQQTKNGLYICILIMNNCKVKYRSIDTMYNSIKNIKYLGY